MNIIDIHKIYIFVCFYYPFWTHQILNRMLKYAQQWYNSVVFTIFLTSYKKTIALHVMLIFYQYKGIFFTGHILFISLLNWIVFVYLAICMWDSICVLAPSPGYWNVLSKGVAKPTLEKDYSSGDNKTS